MSAHNYLFWASLILGGAALIGLLAAKALQPPPGEAAHPAEELTSEPD
jgi:hypothetical protein